MTTIDEAVLLIGFNRPDLLTAVVERVRAAAPPRVYLAVDGPRRDRPGEAELVSACQRVASLVDWDAEVHTLFRDRNLGCGQGVSGAVSWFFEHEERGIILEDDILASSDFFGYAARMLERYDADDRVFAITGTNYVPPQHQSDPSTYRFSRIPVVWGWATWRRAWQRYRFDIAGWRAGLPTRRAWHAMGGTLPSYLLWSANFDVMARHGIDTWDLQFVYACMSASGLTVVPPVNLVENVGFRPDATHTQRRPDHLRAVEPLVVPLREAPVRLDDRADRWMMRNFYGASAAGLARQGTRGVRRLLSGA